MFFVNFGFHWLVLWFTAKMLVAGGEATRVAEPQQSDRAPVGFHHGHFPATHENATHIHIGFNQVPYYILLQHIILCMLVRQLVVLALHGFCVAANSVWFALVGIEFRGVIHSWQAHVFAVGVKNMNPPIIKKNVRSIIHDYFCTCWRKLFLLVKSCPKWWATEVGKFIPIRYRLGCIFWGHLAEMSMWCHLNCHMMSHDEPLDCWASKFHRCRHTPKSVCPNCKTNFGDDHHIHHLSPRKKASYSSHEFLMFFFSYHVPSFLRHPNCDVEVVLLWCRGLAEGPEIFFGHRPLHWWLIHQWYKSYQIMVNYGLLYICLYNYYIFI